jgi:hypothetical protein
MILNYQSLGSFFATSEILLVFNDNVLKYINQKLMMKMFKKVFNNKIGESKFPIICDISRKAHIIKIAIPTFMIISP